MVVWLLQGLNGISLAALLLLVSSGFTVTFGLMRVVNLAHGAYYLIGGYIGFSAARHTGNFWLGVLAGGLTATLIGILSERYLIRPVRQKQLAQVLLTVGMAYVIADICLVYWGGNPVRVAQPEWARGPVNLLGITFPAFRLFLIVFGGAMAILLWALLEKTQIGSIVRAGVDDREMISATGVNIDLLFVIVFAFGAFLTGASGVIGGAFLSLYPRADWEILLYGLVVVIIGGLGSYKGAVVGSLAVGLLDSYGRWLAPELSYFILFAPMVILLAFKPSGLFGREV